MLWMLPSIELAGCVPGGLPRLQIVIRNPAPRSCCEPDARERRPDGRPPVAEELGSE